MEKAGRVEASSEWISHHVVLKETALSRTSLWRIRRDPSSGFPAPVTVTGNVKRWLRSEIREWKRIRDMQRYAG